MPLKPRPKVTQPRTQKVPSARAEVMSAEPPKVEMPAIQPLPARKLLHLDLVTRPTPQDAVRAIVDKYCGPEGERIMQALAVLALGNADSRLAFFGEPFRLKPQDRVRALEVLNQRRWGRPALTVDVDPGGVGGMPVQIINIFAEMPDDDGR